MRKRVRLSGVTVLCLVVIGALSAAAGAAEVAGDVVMEQEAWYYNEPAGAAWSALPEGLPGVDPAARESMNPYTGPALHVGVNAGSPEAHTFVALPVSTLDPGGTAVVTGGTLTLRATGSSDRRADAAEIVACLVTEPVVAELAGEWDAQPKYDCKVRSPAVAVEGSEEPVWTVDLGPFAAAWADPLNNFGVALIPDPDSKLAAPEQSWHVSFHAREYKPAAPSDPKPQPITADLRYTVQDLALAPLAQPDPITPAKAPGGGPALAPMAPTDSTAPGIDPGGLPEPEAALPPAAAPAAPLAAPEPLEARLVSLNDPAGRSTTGLSLLGVLLAGLFGYLLSDQGTVALPRLPRLARLPRLTRASRGGDAPQP